MKDHRVVTRDELYRQVWAEPMETVAKSFGLTGRSLAKICDRLDLPYPYRGYWARVRAGQHAAQYQLRKAKAGTPQSVTISPTPPKAAELNPEKGAMADIPAAPTPVVKVAERLSSPHRIIAAWISEEQERRRIWGSSPRDRPADVAQSRQRRLLDALFKALEKRGHKIEAERGRLTQVRIVIAGRPFSYKFRQRYTQRRLAMTPAELKDPWNVSQGRTTKVLREDTGELVLAVSSEEFSWHIKRQWKDGPATRLEALLGEVVIGLEDMAARADATKTQRDEEDRQRAISERKRYEDEQRRKLDANRFKRLRELAKQRRDAETVRGLIAAMRDQVGVAPDPEMAAWLSWADAHATSLDPLTQGAEAIKADVEAVTAWDYR
jgi:hypothetical protein